jgi:aquaporin Z
MPATNKLITELVGTFVFFSVIALSGAAGPFAPFAPLAIGTALMAMVYMGGPISGAHYNPAVSFAVFLRRKMTVTDMVAYWAVQLVAAALAFTFGYLVSGHTPGIAPGAKADWLQAVAVEITYTAALALVVLNVAATKATQGNPYFGLAIGFTIAAAIYAGGSISGGAYNPAVGFGATFGSAMFANGGWEHLWIYIAGPLVGAAIGAGIHRLQVVETG